MNNLIVLLVVIINLIEASSLRSIIVNKYYELALAIRPDDPDAIISRPPALKFPSRFILKCLAEKGDYRKELIFLMSLENIPFNLLLCETINNLFDNQTGGEEKAMELKENCFWM
jgi:hypothetical protein